MHAKCQLRNILNLQVNQQMGHLTFRKINQTFRSLFRLFLVEVEK